MGKSLFSKLRGHGSDHDEDQPIAVADTTNADMEDEEEGEWLDDNNEGELSVDVFQTADSIVVKSTIAGVQPEDIDISINNDMLTIRGERRHEEQVQEDDYFYQECYWGSFSRSIILPVEVKAEEVDATLKNGVLTVKLPKARKSKSVSIRVNSN